MTQRSHCKVMEALDVLPMQMLAIICFLVCLLVCMQSPGSLFSVHTLGKSMFEFDFYIMKTTKVTELTDCVSMCIIKSTYPHAT